MKIINLDFINNMLKNIVLLCLFITAFSAQNKSTNSGSINNFVPKNWKIISQTSGDLNNDKLKDQVIIIEEMDSLKYKENKNLGPPKLNLNPRNLLILFQGKNKQYQLVLENNKGFVPTENSEDSVCLADPVIEGKMNIKNGVFRISFNYWLSCGSWSVNNAEYIFRWQNEQFELIGYNHGYYHRASGEEEKTSINFSTQKKRCTKFVIDDELGDFKPITKLSKIKKIKPLSLENLDEKIYDEMMELVN